MNATTPITIPETGNDFMGEDAEDVGDAINITDVGDADDIGNVALVSDLGSVGNDVFSDGVVKGVASGDGDVDIEGFMVLVTLEVGRLAPSRFAIEGRLENIEVGFDESAVAENVVNVIKVERLEDNILTDELTAPIIEENTEEV